MVIVRGDLSTGVRYNMEYSLDWNGANEEMVKLRGCAVTISAIAYGQYIISELPAYRWTDEMFECEVEDTTADFASFYDYIGGVQKCQSIR